LRDLQENFINYEQYQDLCSRNGVTETQSQDTLVGFLHDLGIVVNFREDQRLADTHVLNPHWVTNGIYKVLNTDTLARKHGELRKTSRRCSTVKPILRRCLGFCAI
jgi:internalin A